MPRGFCGRRGHGIPVLDSPFLDLKRVLLGQPGTLDDTEAVECSHQCVLPQSRGAGPRSYRGGRWRNRDRRRGGVFVGLEVASEKNLRGREVHTGFDRQICKCADVRASVHACVLFTSSPPMRPPCASPFWPPAPMAGPSLLTVCSSDLPHLGLVQTESGEVTMGPWERAWRAFGQAGPSPSLSIQGSRSWSSWHPAAWPGVQVTSQQVAWM